MSRLAPFDVERAVLGAFMVYPESIHRYRDALTPAHFSDEAHAKIFSVMCDLAQSEQTIERAVILKRCDATPRGSSMPIYLAQLIIDAPGEGGLVDLVDELRESFMRRSARAVFESAAKTIGDVDRVTEKLEEVQAGISALLAATKSGGGHVGALCRDLITRAWSPPAERPQRIRTGLKAFDQVAGPLTAGDLIVLGGSTSAGKTALAGQLAKSIAERALIPSKDHPEQMLGVPVLYISLEMEPDQIAGRLLAMQAAIPLWKIEQDEIIEAERYIVTDAEKYLGQIPLDIETLPRATPEALLAMVMKYQKTKGIGIVFVDHLHYVRSANRKLDRFAAIEDVVMEIKACAKQTKIPWFCLAHLSREVGKRPDKRPHMTDLYGASEIEKSADIVAFVHREAYWLLRDKPKEGTPEYEAWMTALYGTLGTPENPASDGCVNKAEIIVEKRRRGRGVGSSMCEFDENLTMFR